MRRLLFLSAAVALVAACGGAEGPPYAAEPTRKCLAESGYRVEVIDARGDGGALNLVVAPPEGPVSLAFARSTGKARDYAKFERTEGRRAGTRGNVAFSSEGVNENATEDVLDCLRP